MDTIKIIFPLKYTGLTETKAVDVMMEGLRRLIKMDAIEGDLDKILIGYQFSDTNRNVIAELKKESLRDPSKLQSIGGAMVFPLEIDPEKVEIEARQFSVATIQERMRINMMNPKIKFRLTIQDYNKYWKSQQAKIKKSPILAKRLKDMFLVDLTGLFTEVLPYVKEGKQLSQLMGIQAVSDGLTTIARKLSLAYQKALKQAGNGQISKQVFQQLQIQYTSFVNQLIPQVFPGIEEILKTVPNAQVKVFSANPESILTVNSTCNDTLTHIMEEISSKLGKGEEIKITVNGKEFKLNSDDGDEIKSIDSKTITSSEYTVLSDGRFSLFK